MLFILRALENLFDKANNKSETASVFDIMDPLQVLMERNVNFDIFTSKQNRYFKSSLRFKLKL